MGLIEKYMIRMIEQMLNWNWSKKGLPTPSGSRLKLGEAKAAFGRKGSTPVNLSMDQRLRHSLLVGATGSGKSVSLLGILLQDLKARTPFLLIDCHNTIETLLHCLVREITSGRIPENIINDLYWLCPGYDKWTVRINTIECPTPEQAPMRIAAMMALLRVHWGDVLGPQTHEFTQNLLVLMAERKIPLPQVSKLLNSTVDLRTHAMSLLNLRAKEYFLTRYLAWSPRRRSQVSDAFLNKVTIFLGDPRITALLDTPTSDIDFRRAMDENKTILIDISKSQFFDSIGLLASMILVSLQQATFSRSALPESKRKPYYIFIEEFPAFASSVTVEPFLNEARKFGVGLTLIAQTFASLDRALLSSLRANCQTQLFFRLSPEDARIAVAGLTGEVRDYIGRELVSLPIGTAMLMQGGGIPQRLRISHTRVPDKLSNREEEIIERIRKNVGTPLDLSASTILTVPIVRSTATITPVVTTTPPVPSPPVKPAGKKAKRKSPKKKTSDFVEGDA